MKTLIVKVIIRKIDLNNFRFEMLDNRLIEEMKDCFTNEHGQHQLSHQNEPPNNKASGGNKRFHVQLALG